MKMFIRSSGNISPQHSLDPEAFHSRREFVSGDRMRAVEPDYTLYVDSKMIRRMSRIVKMGVAAALACLRRAEVSMPGAIITGTAYGCLEDSSIFLRRMIDNGEELLTPTAFIQSTHNTVGAQIALLLKCHAYNNTIVHRGFSFENALTDASLLLKEGHDLILTGAIDELTEDSHAILRRFGLYREEPSGITGRGAVAGEGASFFLLASTPDLQTQAIITRFSTMYKPTTFHEVEDGIQRILHDGALTIEDIDLVLTGENGDAGHDRLDNHLAAGLFGNKNRFAFKQLCGEYPTASGFAVWLAATLLKGRTPDWFPETKGPLKQILIQTHDMNNYHALYLISAC
jgi:3-oxoacyl-(acyl-carrier-protein) synthase